MKPLREICVRCIRLNQEILLDLVHCSRTQSFPEKCFRRNTAFFSKSQPLSWRRGAALPSFTVLVGAAAAAAAAAGSSNSTGATVLTWERQQHDCCHWFHDRLLVLTCGPAAICESRSLNLKRRVDPELRNPELLMYLSHPRRERATPIAAAPGRPALLPGGRQRQGHKPHIGTQSFRALDDFSISRF